MTDLFAARSQMAMSLAFHILFACVGIAMPLLMVIAERRWIRSGDGVYLTLAKRWAKGTAIMFAVGAVSGTALSFELGLLWPEFMRYAGPIIGMPFSLEGFAFFLEAIFLGIYLYGWDRVRPKVHLMAGIMVFICGTISGIFVVAANAWMNTPTGFDISVGEQIISIASPLDWPPGLTFSDVEVVAVRPFEAMFNPAFPTQALHMTLAAFCAVGFAVAGIHAFMLRRDSRNTFHRSAFSIAFPIGAVSALLIPISGDFAAKQVAEHQPAKLAAMEAHWETEAGADLIIGGWPDEEDEVTRYAIRIPGFLSFLAHGDFDSTVVGLRDIPVDQRPPVLIPHLALQVMVGTGMSLVGVALLGFWLRFRRKSWADSRRFLGLVFLSAPLGFLAVEAGWFVTEVGRQPWIVRGIMRTEEAVSPMPNLVVPFLVFSALYLMLGLIVVALLKHQVFQSPTDEELADA
ncbi:MAG: cytochrome ubiquinol oxidase subunit I [Myxococcales bacterium]|nr:cytochrome ubiquinol oxidase subunit I [Myxococcales bacterium]